jgi:assimilatory nitrate reductase catalytic subunit
LSLYCQGLNQSSSGTDKNSTLINLHLATGQIGKPGAGPLSLTGQPNAMGGREVGGLANLLSAHRDLADPAHRAEVAALWGLPDVPGKPGTSAVEMFQAAADGEIKALWVVCTNPAMSMPDQATVRRAFERAEFVIVQEAYANTATVDHADLLLPAASWGEKSGTVTNSERRISRVRAALSPPGQAREDWCIAVDVARRLEALLPARRADGASLFPYATAEDIWNEHRESTRGRDLDITGLSYARLTEPQFWPFPEGAAQPLARLYVDGHYATADGRARFAAPAWRPTAEVRDARFPVSLNTGRLRDQWHGTSRTGTLGRLFAHAPEPVLELHPQEMARQRWQSGDLVRVKSRRGELVLPVNASSAVLPAQAFIAMHWGPELMAGLGVNALTTGAACPQSRQPELKHTAVRLETAKLPWQVVAAAWLPAGEAPALRQRLRALFAHFPYAICVPFGRETAEVPGRVGVLFRAALAGPDLARLADIEQAFALAEGPVLRYADARAGQRRALRLHSDGTLQGFMLAGDVAAQAWVLDLLQQGQPAAAFGRALLSARSTPPAPVLPRSPQVCACHDVSEQAIVAALPLCIGAADERLQQLQGRLRCGTECGSCLPALKTLLNRIPCEVTPA